MKLFIFCLVTGFSATALFGCGDAKSLQAPQGAGTTSLESGPAAAAVAAPSGTTKPTCPPAAAPAAAAAAAAAAPSVAPAGHGLDPNAFAYAYESYVGTNVGPGGGVTADSIVILTTDPHACDTGTLVLHPNSPTISARGSSFHGRAMFDTFTLNTTSPVGPAQCALFGGDPSHSHTVTGSFLWNNPYESGFTYTYDLAIDSVPATLAEVPGWDQPVIITHPCKFATGANAVVPCP